MRIMLVAIMTVAMAPFMLLGYIGGMIKQSIWLGNEHAKDTCAWIAKVTKRP